jgi:hypothetical protein
MTCLLWLACVLAPTARADNPLAAALHTGPILDIGISSGGDDLAKSALAGKYAGGDGFTAGGGLTLGVGVVELLGDSPFGLKQELSYTHNDNCDYGGLYSTNNQCSISGPYGYNFDHINVAALLLVDLSHWSSAPWTWSLGLGGTYVINPNFQVTDTNYHFLQQSDFRNAHGWIAQVRVGALVLRYTHVHYVPQGSGQTIDGSNYALMLDFQF